MDECKRSPRYFPQLICDLPRGHTGDHHCGEYTWPGDDND